jgi:hypothetical protein
MLPGCGNNLLEMHFVRSPIKNILNQELMDGISFTKKISPIHREKKLDQVFFEEENIRKSIPKDGFSFAAIKEFDFDIISQ